MTKRAIALAGGGPAAALHIGALEYLNEQGIKFDQPTDIWALSCIGAWVGVYYQQCDQGREPEQTKKFFRDNVFRDDVSYSRFPINAVFGPDSVGLIKAAVEYLTDTESYRNLFLPDKIVDAGRRMLEFSIDSKQWNQGDFSKLALELNASNPAMRFLMSFMYLSNLNGLSRIYYKGSTFLNSINFDRLRQSNKPFIFHNAFNLDTKKIELFANRVINKKYQLLDGQSVCACSALPYIEETVRFENGTEYCEGALVDTVNFKDLIEDHNVDEIWVSKIVNYEEIRTPRNICDALGNLCMLFAATVGDDDIKLFKYHARLDREQPWLGDVIELDFGAHSNFDWNHANFDKGIKAGQQAAAEALRKHKSGYFQEQAAADRKRWAQALA